MAGDVPRGTGGVAHLLFMADQGDLVQVVRVALEASGVLGVAVAAHLEAAALPVDGNKSNRTQIFIDIYR